MVYAYRHFSEIGEEELKVKVDKSAENDIKLVLREFISESFLPSSGVNIFNDTDSFMDKGIIDSTGVLELLEFVEEQFNIIINDEEVIPENLDSLNKLSSFINRKMEHARQ